MRSYVRRIAVATALALGALPGAAAAGPIVTVGLSVPAPGPVVVVRPAPPAPDYVWVDGAWVSDPAGRLVWVDGYWTPAVTRTVVVSRPVIVSRPVVTHTTVVHRGPTVVTHAGHGRTVVVHR